MMALAYRPSEGLRVWSCGILKPCTINDGGSGDRGSDSVRDNLCSSVPNVTEHIFSRG